MARSAGGGGGTEHADSVHDPREKTETGAGVPSQNTSRIEAAWAGRAEDRTGAMGRLSIGHSPDAGLGERHAAVAGRNGPAISHARPGRAQDKGPANARRWRGANAEGGGDEQGPGDGRAFAGADLR